MKLKSQSDRRPRRGVVLLAVLVVIVLLSLAAYQYSDMMLAEYKASVNAHHAAQARAFADSGIAYAALLLSTSENIASVNGNIYDNPTSFRDVVVGGDDAKSVSGRFWLIAPPDPSDTANTGTWRSGVTDESGKINPNSIVRLDPTGEVLYNMLLKLPNITDDLAAPIADWVDADDTARQNGAESDYYSGLVPAYRAKNGPLDSIDELLLVKGINRDILYGNDLNVNGIQDANETVNADGYSRGLAAYLTVQSREQNINPDTGLALTYINGSDLSALFESLAASLSNDDLAKFIIMYEQYGPSNSTGQTQSLANSLKAVVKAAQGGGKGGGGKGGGSTTPPTVEGKLSSWTPDFTKKASQKISSFYDLISAQVSIAGKDPKKDPTVIYKSPLSDAAARRELLPKLFQNATIFQESDLPARINVNTAPQAVLAALPDLTDSDVQTIMSVRPALGADQAPDPIFNTPAWLLTEAKLKTDTLKKLEKYITTKSQVYRVQALGYFNGPGPTARVEAVIDTHSGRPRIIMWRALTELGTSGMKNNQP